MKRNPMRQGDVLFIPIAARRRPKKLSQVARDRGGRIVLAEGETTGHAHAILDDPATLFCREDLDEMADRFLRVESEVAVVHEEHAPVKLAPGDWIVRRKREYSPEEIRRVSD